MSDPAIVAVVSAVAALAAAVVTAVLGRRSAREANEVNRFEASLAGLETRIESLERELQTVKTALVAEQQQHAATRDLLRIAMKHIRDMLSWLGGDRRVAPPDVPDELTHHL